MDAFPNLAEPNETQETIHQMILASDELAGNLATSRDKWSAKDHELARLIEGLRIQFSAFAVAARAGRVCDPMLLRTIGRAYEGVSRFVCELATEVDGARAARACVAKASQLTGYVADIVERNGAN